MLAELRVDPQSQGPVLVARAQTGAPWSIPIAVGAETLAELQRFLDQIDARLAHGPVPDAKPKPASFGAASLVAGAGALAFLFTPLGSWWCALPLAIAALRGTAVSLAAAGAVSLISVLTSPGEASAAALLGYGWASAPAERRIETTATRNFMWAPA